MLGGGGGACDPGAQAVDRPQPGEEAGGFRPRAQPTQALAFLLVSKLSSAGTSTITGTHTSTQDACHVHAPRSHPHTLVTDGSAGLASAKGEREGE